MHSQFLYFGSFPQSYLRIFPYFLSVTFLNEWLIRRPTNTHELSSERVKAGPTYSDGHRIFLPGRMRDKPYFSMGKNIVVAGIWCPILKGLGGSKRQMTLQITSPPEHICQVFWFLWGQHQRVRSRFHSKRRDNLLKGKWRRVGWTMIKE